MIPVVRPVSLVFCSTEHLADWLIANGIRESEAMDLPALAERSKREWSQLVA
jgi:hypothetical protein